MLTKITHPVLRTGIGRIGTLLLLCLISVHCGCSDEVAQQKQDVARKIVVEALDSWKQGAKPKDLMDQTEPVEFHDDDWKRSAKLLEYEVLQTFIEYDDTARCSVRLKVQRKNKEPVDVECTYQIVTEPEVIVARDPMS